MAGEVPRKKHFFTRSAGRFRIAPCAVPRCVRARPVGLYPMGKGRFGLPPVLARVRAARTAVVPPGTCL